MKLKNETYDTLKWIAMVFLPALATFYIAVATIWGAPYVDQISGTIIALDTFLGAILHVSTKQYNKFSK